MSKRLHAIVHGDVQGVSFRDFTRESAQKLALVGTVWNCPDGTVEIIAEGEGEVLKKFALLLRADYPYAKVTRIDEVWSEAAGTYSDFCIIF